VSDRDKISFSELDRLRREKRSGGGQRQPRGGRSRASSAAYRRRVEERLFGKKGDGGRMRLEERLRNAHGSSNFQRVYREFVKGFGMPEEFGLLLLLLDLDDASDLVRVVGALGSALEDASLEQRSLLRSRLRNLEMSAPSDAVADAAADLLGRL
jgi:hypothetical protein